jgi:predicted DNA-binding protein YlxM (UPF0122 family)
MDYLEKREYYSFLFDFYQSILTEKQQEYFKEYYFDDLSLAEIADISNISRNAVYDQLQKVHSLLDIYEEKLGLYRKHSARCGLYDEYYDESNGKLKQLISRLKELE